MSQERGAGLLVSVKTAPAITARFARMGLPAAGEPHRLDPAVSLLQRPDLDDIRRWKSTEITSRIIQPPLFLVIANGRIEFDVGGPVIASG